MAGYKETTGDIEELLCYLDHCIEKRRQFLSILCKEKEILFNPWPKANEEKEIKKEEIIKEEDKYTPEEKEGLNMINHLLKKAEKAKLIQKKMKEKYESEDIEENIVHEDNKDQKDDVEEIENEDVSGKIINDEKSSDQTESVIKVQTESARKSSNNISGNNITITESNELLKTKNMKNAILQRRSSSQKVESKKSLKSTTRKPQINSESSTSKTALTISTKHCPHSRDSVSTVRPSSSLSNRCKKAPVHMSAPFKTDPTIKVPKRPSSSLSIVKPEKVVKSKYMNSLKQKSNKNQTTTLPKSHTVSSKLKCNMKSRHASNSLSEVPSKSDVDQTPTTALVADTENFQTVDSIVNENNNKSEPSADIDKLNAEVNKLYIDERNSPCGTESKPDIPKLFDLLHDGASLQIPVKLKKLLIQNRKLKQNVEKVALTKKVDMNSKENFLEKLESMFDRNNELGIQYRKLQCLNAHKKLLKMLKDLQLETINELSTAHDVLQAKMMVEFVLTAYHDYEDETKELLKGSKKAMHSHQKVIEVKPNSSLLRDWLPHNFKRDDFTAPTQLIYRSRAELQKYESSYFKLQWLQMQKAIMSTVKLDLLQELAELDPSDREFVSMYRGIYSLLTSFGNHLPSVIQETS